SIMSPPASACWPSAKCSRMVHTRPPTRARASITVTSAPWADKSRAPARPARPAPATRTEDPRRVLALHLVDSVGLGLEQLQRPIWSDQMRRADDDERVAGPAEQSFELRKPGAIPIDEQPLIQIRIALEVGQDDVLDGGRVSCLPGIGELRDVRLFGIQ